MMTSDLNQDLGFALFDTAVGRCGIAWSARGIAGLQLPEKTEPATRARMLRRYPGAVEAVRRTMSNAASAISAGC